MVCWLQAFKGFDNSSPKTWFPSTPHRGPISETGKTAPSYGPKKKKKGFIKTHTHTNVRIRLEYVQGETLKKNNNFRRIGQSQKHQIHLRRVCEKRDQLPVWLWTECSKDFVLPTCWVWLWINDFSGLQKKNSSGIKMQLKSFWQTPSKYFDKTTLFFWG